VGITRGTNRAHIIRAAEEAIAYQSKDLLDAISEDAGFAIGELRVDGGASADSFLMQFQADILGIPVRRPMIRETTALGAAYLAGLAVGFWRDLEEIKARWSIDKIFEPHMGKSRAESLCADWKRAVERSLGWAARE
jgi:glycerol kinase